MFEASPQYAFVEELQFQTCGCAVHHLVVDHKSLEALGFYWNALCCLPVERDWPSALPSAGYVPWVQTFLCRQGGLHEHTFDVNGFPNLSYTPWVPSLLLFFVSSFSCLASDLVPSFVVILKVFFGLCSVLCRKSESPCPVLSWSCIVALKKLHWSCYVWLLTGLEEIVQHWTILLQVIFMCVQFLFANILLHFPFGVLVPNLSFFFLRCVCVFSSGPLRLLLLFKHYMARTWISLSWLVSRVLLGALLRLVYHVCLVSCAVTSKYNSQGQFHAVFIVSHFYLSRIDVCWVSQKMLAKKISPIQKRDTLFGSKFCHQILW